jgi:hypothetical protein
MKAVPHPIEGNRRRFQNLGAACKLWRRGAGPAPKPRRKAGTSVRGTGGWDDSMIAARGQAEGYVRALSDDNPPFLLVIDIGHSFELYADFSRLGKVYTAFPDARSHRRIARPMALPPALPA